MTLNTLQKMFQNTSDIKFQQYNFNGHKVHFITCEAMFDQRLLNRVIVPRVEFILHHLTNEKLEKQLISHLYIPNLKRIYMKEEATSLVFKGFVLLYFEDDELLFSSNIAKKPNRLPSESRIESTIKGPRDNFVEDLAVNIALIRKRLPTKSLFVEKIEIGNRSKTSIAILYFEDIVNKEILSNIKEKLNKIETDAVFSGEVLMERMNNSPVLFPINNYTGKPDFVVQTLLRGRFVILVDGVSYAMFTPVNLLLFLKTSEDNEYPVLFGAITRSARMLGILISTLLPAFWLSLISFQQDQLPFQLLATVVQSRNGIPVPASMEILTMMIVFELFREAGIRLPSFLGATISVVGAIMIGNAAIEMGITSQAMVIVIATSTVASYITVNQTLGYTITILRFAFVFFSSFFGMFAFFISFFFLLVYLANIRVFGVPYLSMGTDLNWRNIEKALFRLPADKYNKRPEILGTSDKTREKNEDN